MCMIMIDGDDNFQGRLSVQAWAGVPPALLRPLSPALRLAPPPLKPDLLLLALRLQPHMEPCQHQPLRQRPHVRSGIRWKNLSLIWEKEDVGFDWKKNITQFQIEQGTFPARNQEVTQGRGYTGQTTGDNILITASASSFQSIIITIKIIIVIKIIMIMKITRCYYTNMDYLTPPGMHSGLNVPVRKPFFLPSLLSLSINMSTCHNIDLSKNLPAFAAVSLVDNLFKISKSVSQEAVKKLSVHSLCNSVGPFSHQSFLRCVRQGWFLTNISSRFWQILRGWFDKSLGRDIMWRRSVEIAAQLVSVTANLTFGQSCLLIRSQDDCDEEDSHDNGIQN